MTPQEIIAEAEDTILTHPHDLMHVGISDEHDLERELLKLAKLYVECKEKDDAQSND